MDKIELKITDHICSETDFFVVACDDKRDGYWYITDFDGENMIDTVSYCPFCGNCLRDLNRIVCGFCQGKDEDCKACFGSGWEQIEEEEGGVEAPIYYGLMDKIKENQEGKEEDEKR